MLQLRDGSVVELRERSGFSTIQSRQRSDHPSGPRQHHRAGRQAQLGPLYVATADCRVAVTGTVFSVSLRREGLARLGGQGEVHVSQDNQEKVLHPGDQTVTSPNLEPRLGAATISAGAAIATSCMQQLESCAAASQQIQLPALRYSSSLLDRLPAIHRVLRQHSQSRPVPGGSAGRVQPEDGAEPRTARLVGPKGAEDRAASIEKLRAASEYLGDEIVVAGLAAAERPDRRPGIPRRRRNATASPSS